MFQHSSHSQVKSIAFYMHDLSGGGVERMRLALIAALRRQGIAVTLVVQSCEGPLRNLLPADLSIVELGSTRTLAAIRPLAAFLRSKPPDVLVSSLDHNNLAAIAAKILSGGKVPLIICQHNAVSAERQLGWKYYFIPLIYRVAARFANNRVAVSDGVADDWSLTCRIPRSRIETIYNPVIGEDFVARTEGLAPHPWFGDIESTVFVFVGRLEPQKDPNLLLRGFALSQSQMKSHLIILGVGKLRVEMEALANHLGIFDRVCFVGYQENPLPWIAHADALVLTSRYEGLGNVIIEALACGTPVIATDCPYGPAEILGDGAFGRLIGVGDASALARALCENLRDLWPAETLKRRARKFTVDACAEQHLKIFESIISSQRVAKQRVLGMKFSVLGAAEIADLVLCAAPPSHVHLLVTPNIDHVRALQKKDFADAYKNAECICPDGFPVVFYARARGVKRLSRVTGCEIFHQIAAHPNFAKQRVFLVLESEMTAVAARGWAHARGLSNSMAIVVAPLNLAKSVTAQSNLAGQIRDYQATLVVMTLGAPVSEVFVNSHRASLPPCWAICVGQAVRVELGLVRRAPAAWQAANAEWLWRLIREPRRLGFRYLSALVWFPLAVLRDLSGCDQTARDLPRS